VYTHAPVNSRCGWDPAGGKAETRLECARLSLVHGCRPSDRADQVGTLGGQAQAPTGRGIPRHRTAPWEPWTLSPIGRVLWPAKACPWNLPKTNLIDNHVKFLLYCTINSCSSTIKHIHRDTRQWRKSANETTMSIHPQHTAMSAPTRNPNAASP
jgi:hypothetical protein